MYLAHTIIPGITELLDKIDEELKEKGEDPLLCGQYGGAVAMATVFLDDVLGEGNWYFTRDAAGNHVLLSDMREGS